MQMHLIIKKLRLTTNSSTKYQWTVRTFAAIKFMRMAFNCNTDLQHKVHLKTVKNEIEYLFLCSSQYPRYWLILIHSIVYALSVASFVVRSAARCDLSIKSWYCAKKASIIHESKVCVCLRTKKIFVFSENPRPTIILNKWISVDFVFYYNFSLLFFFLVGYFYCGMCSFHYGCVQKVLRETKFTAGYFWVENFSFFFFQNGIGYFRPETVK